MICINSLKQQLDNAIKNFSGTWSYLIEKKSLSAFDASAENAAPAVIKYQADIQHKSASMIKVLILVALCLSDVDFKQKLRVDSVPRVEGGGALQEINGDAELTVISLANLMIVLSDNLATNLLINRLGMANIQRCADDLQLTHTQLNRCMMDFTAAMQGKENFTSADDYNKLLWYIYANRQKPRFAAAWQILARQQFRDRIPYYWDEAIIFHHKTGMLDHVEHDGGIYEISGKATFSIIIFASDLPSNAVGGRQMGELGKIILTYIHSHTS